MNIRQYTLITLFTTTTLATASCDSSGQRRRAGTPQPGPAQADRWARVVHGSDLEDIEWEPGTIRCGGLKYDFQKEVLDDLLLMVAAVDLDGGPRAGSAITYCGYRESSKLPLIGALKLDIDGVPLMTTQLAAGTDYLSAITILSLADIGYTVNLDEADRFVVGAGSNASASVEEGRHAIDLSGDVVAVPAAFYDRHGRVVRVVRPN